MVDQWRDAAAVAIGIRQIRRRGGAGPARRSRPRLGAGGSRTADRIAAAAPAGNRSSQLIRVFDGFDFLALADLQRAVLCAAGALDAGRRPDLSAAAANFHAGRQGLGAQQHLADEPDMSYQSGISRRREDSERSADCRIKVAVEEGDFW